MCSAIPAVHMLSTLSEICVQVWLLLVPVRCCVKKVENHTTIGFLSGNMANFFLIGPASRRIVEGRIILVAP